MSQHIFLGIFGSCTILGNLCSFLFLFRRITKGRNKTTTDRQDIVYKISITFIDLFFGLYLVSLLLVDFTYKEEFGRNAERWRLTWQCSVLNFCSFQYMLQSLVLVSKHSVVILISTVTLIRPEGNFSLSLLIWIICFGFNIMINVLTLKIEPSLQNYICFPIPMKTPKTIAMLLLHIFLSLVHIIFILQICICFLVTMFLIRRHDKSFTEMRKHQNKHGSRYLKMSLYIALIAGSRVPLFLAQCLSLANVFVKHSDYVWILTSTVVLWPVINPFRRH